MVRGRKVPLETDVEEPKVVSDNKLLALRDAAIKKMGKSNVFHGDSFMDMIYGVHIKDNLALQHLLGVDVFALGRSMTIAGKFGATKSSLAVEICRCFSLQSGLGVVIDSEDKTNPNQFLSIYGGDRNVFDNAFLYTKTGTLNEDMEAIKFYTGEYPNLYPQCDKPLVVVWDSLSAHTSEEAIKKQNEGKASEYQGARNAGEIQEFLKAYLPKKVSPYPILFVVVNHLKDKVGAKVLPGQPIPTYSPGGSHKDFAYTYALELRKGGSLKSKVCTIKYVMIKTGKSSLGPTYQYAIKVPYVSYYKDDGDEIIYYDWDFAITDLLTGENLSKELVKDVMHISRQGNKCSSSTLGLKDVSPSEMGKAIHANAQLCEDLQKHVLRIRVKRKLGVPLNVTHAAPPIDISEVSRVAAEGNDEQKAALAISLPDESDEEDQESSE